MHTKIKTIILFSTMLFVSNKIFSQIETILTFIYEDSTLIVRYNDDSFKSIISYEADYVDDKLKISVFYNQKLQRTYLIQADKDTTIEYTSFEGLGPVKKPVIYLYPQKPQDIDLQMSFAGNVTFTYPPYNKGWKIRTFPDGTIINLADNSLHRYLFWEGETSHTFIIDDFTTGFVVEGKKIVSFVDSILTAMSLTAYEKNDFITFWCPILSQYDYVFVHFLQNNQCDVLCKYKISANFDTQIRIYMLYTPLNNKIEISPQNISKINRKGSIFVEWGGMQIKKIETK